MGCLSGIAKYILFLFNLLILIAAIALIALGVIYKTKNVGLDIMSVSSYTIALGVIIALVSFFGCCGAIKESNCLLTSYAFIMITIFIAQVVLIVLAFLAVRNGSLELDTEIEKYLTKLYERFLKGGSDADAVNGLQREFECCGIDSSNYTLVTIPNSINLIDSCCEKQYNNRCTKDKAYEELCTEAIRDFIQSNSKIIGGIAIGVALVEITAAIFSCWVKNRKY
ncbi:hypothetical protein JTB14_032684 [Gonioctena quinquepunctata]|nr:hypothetical protein JTB14_032684 [Gonioctena quinquepunctata]